MRVRENQLPRISRLWLGWFSRYANGFLGRNFHAVHLLQLSGLEAFPGKSLLVCMNHPSWWDPLIALSLSQRLFADRAHYGPMAAKAVSRYKFFERLGFFGIDPQTRAGAARFLAVGTCVLNDPKAALWVTPQGAFSDVRKPVEFEMGVAHLALHAGPFVMLPIALEYAFWDERYPEAFVCIGHPLFVDDGRSASASEWSSRFAKSLQVTQEALASRVIARDAAAFETLITGRAGIGGIYDMWRSLRARLQGRKFHPEHGNL